MRQRRFALALASLGWITAASPAQAGDVVGPVFYAYNYTNDHLVSFSGFAPNDLTSNIALTGLAGDEFLVGIDFRPATGELYAVATSSGGDRLVTIDPVTGAVASVTPSPFTSIAGGYFGLDFNPVPDRLRVISNTGTSLRIIPDTGAILAVDTSLTYAPGDPGSGQSPVVVHVAYTNSFAGATTTTLFGIDVARDVLVRIGGVNGTPSPNGGIVTTIGSLGVDATNSGGFDIDPESGNGFAALRVGGVSSLYVVNLATGTATLVGAIGSGGDFDGLAVPEADACASALVAGLALACTRRSRA